MLLQVFLSFMKIGALAFGGAYAAIPLVEKEVVLVQQWMSYEEFANLVAIDELTPGPIIVNAASFVGMHIAGIPGAIIATLGSIIPALVLALILVIIYKRYTKLSWLQTIINSLKCMAFALIFTTFISIASNSLFGSTQISFNNFNIFALIMVCFAFYFINRKKTSPVLVMLICGIINVIFYLLSSLIIL